MKVERVPNEKSSTTIKFLACNQIWIIIRHVYVVIFFYLHTKRSTTSYSSRSFGTFNNFGQIFFLIKFVDMLWKVCSLIDFWPWENCVRYGKKAWLVFKKSALSKNSSLWYNSKFPQLIGAINKINKY
jgi:hypothetical protein